MFSYFSFSFLGFFSPLAMPIQNHTSLFHLTQPGTTTWVHVVLLTVIFQISRSRHGWPCIIRSVSSKNSFKLYVTSATQLWRVWKFSQWIFCCTNLYIYQRIFNSRFSYLFHWVLKQTRDQRTAETGRKVRKIVNKSKPGQKIYYNRPRPQLSSGGTNQ